jgi:hypothetical protein
LRPRAARSDKAELCCMDIGPYGPLHTDFIFWANTMKVSVFLVCFSSIWGVCVGLDNGLALTPPMGWNSWNKFGCEVNSTLIKATAVCTRCCALVALVPTRHSHRHSYPHSYPRTHTPTRTRWSALDFWMQAMCISTWMTVGTGVKWIMSATL